MIERITTRQAAVLMSYRLGRRVEKWRLLRVLSEHGLARSAGGHSQYWMLSPDDVDRLVPYLQRR